MAAISKVTGTKMTYHGKTAFNANDFDAMTQDLKKGVDKVGNLWKKVIAITKASNTNKEKFELLREASELRESGAITEAEFEIIKNKVLASIDL